MNNPCIDAALRAFTTYVDAANTREYSLHGDADLLPSACLAADCVEGLLAEVERLRDLSAVETERCVVHALRAVKVIERSLSSWASVNGAFIWAAAFDAMTAIRNGTAAPSETTDDPDHMDVEPPAATLLFAAQGLVSEGGPAALVVSDLIREIRRLRDLLEVDPVVASLAEVLQRDGDKFVVRGITATEMMRRLAVGDPVATAFRNRVYACAVQTAALDAQEEDGHGR